MKALSRFAKFLVGFDRNKIFFKEYVLGQTEKYNLDIPLEHFVDYVLFFGDISDVGRTWKTGLCRVSDEPQRVLHRDQVRRREDAGPHRR
jgi:hypothetical protein